jgi:transcriptional regulator with XRE-family HTH domain
VPKNTRERFGDRVKELRAEKGWTQEDLSAESGIGRVFVSQIENGHKDVCLGVIEALADSFEVSISELMRGV